ncbi:hypothetical protein J6590_047713 [Homalodisca vitripennis]|nr:hypothetical protein J6590_047713 [Homalodisca vitripennis]
MEKTFTSPMTHSYSGNIDEETSVINSDLKNISRCLMTVVSNPMWASSLRLRWQSGEGLAVCASVKLGIVLDRNLTFLDHVIFAISCHRISKGAKERIKDCKTEIVFVFKIENFRVCASFSRCCWRFDNGYRVPDADLHDPRGSVTWRVTVSKREVLRDQGEALSIRDPPSYTYTPRFES